jgi:putative two-component system response regulator
MSRPIRVLYVDDYPLDRQLVRDALEREHGGFVVTEAASRVEFEAAIARGEFDLVLSDFNILGYQGLQVLETVRARAAGVPVVIVTGTGSEEVAVEAMRLGAADYIIKSPKHIQRLPIAIHAVLERRALEEERTRSAEQLRELNAELLAAYNATIEGWARALDLRDRESEGHSRRVTELTLALAAKLGIPPEQWVHIRRGALLHDMGKLGVPDRILLKPGALTEDEWMIMRQHPQYAQELLGQVSFLRPALDIPFCHHENWDGTGYPRGLRGEEIPLVARLFAVVDVWDALCSDRPYRPAWTRAQANAHLRSLAGTQLDPNIVPVFLELVDRE